MHCLTVSLQIAVISLVTVVIADYHYSTIIEPVWLWSIFIVQV